MIINHPLHLQIKRYSRKEKKIIPISILKVILEYNLHMGKVDPLR